VGRRPDDRPSLQSNRLDGCTASAITHGAGTLIRMPDGGGAAQLFDLERDPGERSDVSEDRPVMAGYLGRLLDREESALGAPVGRARAQPDAESVEQLRALGYAGR
jgi:hypothetical protein